MSTHVTVQQKDYEVWRIDREVYKSANPKKEQTESNTRIVIIKKSKRKNTHAKKEKPKTYNRPSTKRHKHPNCNEQ